MIHLSFTVLYVRVRLFEKFGARQQAIGFFETPESRYLSL